MARFGKDNPGKPGRERGSRNKATLMREAIGRAVSAADGISVIRAQVKKAKAGDSSAAKLVLPYLCPPGTYVKIDLPAITDAASIAEAQARLMTAASNEELSLEQADLFSDILEKRRRALETVEIERNLQQAQENLVERENAEKSFRP
jgi:hypothetical protein